MYRVHLKKKLKFHEPSFVCKFPHHHLNSRQRRYGLLSQLRTSLNFCPGSLGILIFVPQNEAFFSVTNETQIWIGALENRSLSSHCFETSHIACPIFCFVSLRRSEEVVWVSGAINHGLNVKIHNEDWIVLVFIACTFLPVIIDMVSYKCRKNGIFKLCFAVFVQNTFFFIKNWVFFIWKVYMNQ